MEDIDKEDDRKPSGDEGEVVFSQQEKVVATLGPYGLTVDRQNEHEWLDDTEPYNGARPRMMQERRPTMDVDQLVDSVLGATAGTTGVIGSDVPWLECPACNALTWIITVTE